jgi:hypothetical protein
MDIHAFASCPEIIRPGYQKRQCGGALQDGVVPATPFRQCAGQCCKIGGQFALRRDAALRRLALPIDARQMRNQQSAQHRAPLASGTWQRPGKSPRCAAMRRSYRPQPLAPTASASPHKADPR